jgi:hypothetical protein
MVAPAFSMVMASAVEVVRVAAAHGHPTLAPQAIGAAHGSGFAPAITMAGAAALPTTLAGGHSPSRIQRERLVSNPRNPRNWGRARRVLIILMIGSRKTYWSYPFRSFPNGRPGANSCSLGRGYMRPARSAKIIVGV